MALRASATRGDSPQTPYESWLPAWSPVAISFSGLFDELGGLVCGDPRGSETRGEHVLV